MSQSSDAANMAQNKQRVRSGAKRPSANATSSRLQRIEQLLGLLTEKVEAIEVALTTDESDADSDYEPSSEDESLTPCSSSLPVSQPAGASEDAKRPTHVRFESRAPCSPTGPGPWE